MLKKHLVILLSFLLIVLSSCAKSAIENTVDTLTPDKEITEENLNNFTAKVNGENFTASKLIESLAVGNLTQYNSGYLMIIVAFDISTDIENPKAIELFLYGSNFADVTVGTKYNTVTKPVFPEPGAFAVFLEDPNTNVDDDEISTENLDEILIEITNINREKKLISGTFSFIGRVENTNTTYSITDGEFQNISYQE